MKILFGIIQIARRAWPRRFRGNARAFIERGFHAGRFPGRNEKLAGRFNRVDIQAADPFVEQAQRLVLQRESRDRGSPVASNGFCKDVHNVRLVSPRLLTFGRFTYEHRYCWYSIWVGPALSRTRTTGTITLAAREQKRAPETEIMSSMRRDAGNRGTVNRKWTWAWRLLDDKGFPLSHFVDGVSCDFRRWIELLKRERSFGIR